MKYKCKSFQASILSLLFCSLMVTPSYSEEKEEKENLLGFDAKSDLRVGPVFSVGVPLSVNNANVSYSPVLSLNFHGESYVFGSTGFDFSWISSNRNMSILPAGQGTTLKFSEVSPGNQVTKISKNLLILTLSSPINYSPGNVFEFGWLGGIFNQSVTPNQNLGGDSASNLGLNLGAYLKTYQFYPFVPYVNGKFIFGNMYDNGKTQQENRGLQSSLKGGYFLSGGLNIYITRRILLNVGYNLMNPDFYYFSPTRAIPVQPGQVSTSPKDDTSTNFDESVQYISGSFGFLF